MKGRFGDDAHRMLQAYRRQQETMPAAAREQALTALSERVASGPEPRVDVAPPKVASGLGVIGIVIPALLIAGGVGGAIAVGMARAEPQAVAPAPVLRQQQPAEDQTSPARERSTRPAARTVHVQPSDDIAPEASPRPPPRARPPTRGRPREPADTAEASPPEDALAAEMKVLADAHAALKAGDARAALVHLREHADRFPQGKMKVARQVSRIVALCRSGATAQARLEAERFLDRTPRSPHADRVRSVCRDADDVPATSTDPPDRGHQMGR